MVKALLYFLFLVISIAIFDNFVVENYYIYIVATKKPLYVILYIMQISTLIIALHARNLYLKIISFSFIFITSTIFTSYQLISHSGFNRYEALLAIDQFTYAGDALSAYFYQIVQAIIINLIFYSIIYFLIHKTTYRIKSQYALLPFIFISIFFALTIKSGVILKSMLSPFQVSFSVYYALSGKQYFGQRDPVSREVEMDSKFDKIVLLMDESVRGDMLSVNGYSVDTTPYLKSIKNEFYNYGIASSGFNCSTASNILVQSGLREELLPDKEQFSLKSANIFDYMNKAGYTTIFIDGQNTGIKPIHAMTIYDIKNINIYHQLLRNKEKIDRKDMDMHIANLISIELKKYKKVFIYVNKSGSHFPYESNYPVKEDVFLNQIKNRENINDKQIMKYTYFNALKWGVDEFFKKLLPLVDESSPLILYTSDHGQNSFDNDRPRTHCNGNPTSYEGNVPFMIFAVNNSKETFEDMYIKGQENNNRLSHFNIFPTLIEFAGYKLEKNEKSVFDTVPSKRKFYSGDIWGRTTLNTIDFKIIE